MVKGFCTVKSKEMDLVADIEQEDESKTICDQILEITLMGVFYILNN